MENNALNGLTLALAAAGFATTGGGTTHATTATVPYAIKGKHRTPKTAITGGTTPTADYVSGNPITLVANQGRSVVWCFDSAGAVKVVAGPIVPYVNAAFSAPPQFPQLPDDICPFAYQVLMAGSTAVGTVTFGTTNWNATGFTNAVQDVLNLPDRPQVS